MFQQFQKFLLFLLQSHDYYLKIFVFLINLLLITFFVMFGFVCQTYLILLVSRLQYTEHLSVVILFFFLFHRVSGLLWKLIKNLRLLIINALVFFRFLMKIGRKN